MKTRIYTLFIIFTVFSAFQTLSAQRMRDTLIISVSDSLLTNPTDTIPHISAPKTYKYTFITPNGNWESDSIIRHRLDSLIRLPIPRTDSLLYRANPLLAPLAFMGKELTPLVPPDMKKINLYERAPLADFFSLKINEPPVSATEFTQKMRADLRDEITRRHAHWYYITYDKLPDASNFHQRAIGYKPIGSITVTERFPTPEKDKIALEEIQKMYWRRKANAQLQFSQNYISSNWYQGGNSNLAFLSIFSGQILYDNLKNIQWENNLEWRAGFNSTEGDTLRKIATNDDVLRYNTKFGLKAYGKWYYSISGEVATQLFDSYKGINSKELKGRIFTPVRVNVGIGMDYKYKKIFSLMIAPLSVKYIYANDTAHVNPHLFGIKKGKNQLRETGSSLRAQLNYPIMQNWQIDSRLTFFTNYKKVETDWEIINTFNINRFITVRLMLNPRYDNTIILKEGETSKIQFKQLSSIGLSFRFF